MPSYRFNYSGTLYALDVFQHGFVVTGSGSLTAASTAAVDWLDDFLGASGVAAIFGTGVLWSTVIVQQLGGFGQPIVDSAITSVAEAGTGTSVPTPPQNAICVSMLTGLAGARNRGRFYLPPPVSSAVTTTGRLGTTQQTALVDGLGVAFSGLATAGFTPIVRSSVGGGAETVVTSVRVGNVIDTQRRRRNAIAEVYVTEDL